MAVLTSLRAMFWTAAGASRDDDGQTMAEYGMILAGIAVVVVLVVALLGTAISDAFQSVVDSF